MSIFVVWAFIKMRQAMAANNALVEKLRELENRLTQRLDTHEQAVVYVLAELRRLTEPPQQPELKRRPIGFGRPIFSWGSINLKAHGAARSAYLKALREADENDYKSLIIFARQ